MARRRRITVLLSGSLLLLGNCQVLENRADLLGVDLTSSHALRHRWRLVLRGNRIRSGQRRLAELGHTRCRCTASRRLLQITKQAQKQADQFRDLLPGHHDIL